MRSFFIVLLAVLTLTPACKQRFEEESSSDVKFFGEDSVQAQMTFDTYFIYDARDDMSEDEKNLEMNYYLGLHIEHLFGALKEHPNTKRLPGIISMKRKITPISIKEFEKNHYRIDYSFEGKAVFKKELLKDGDRELKLYLPKNVQKIYRQGMSESGSSNLCTDHHYNSEGDFWYFWNPFQSGCPITEDQIVEVNAKLKKIPSTSETYPEYAMFGKAEGPKKKLRMLFIRSMDHSMSDPGDNGRYVYNLAVSKFEELGFVSTPESSEFHKIMEISNDAYDVELNAYFMDHTGSEFSKVVADQMPKVDLFIYAGHSGLGGTLPINRLSRETDAPFTLPKDKYQIIFFNGCSTYAYYNENYFELKKSERDPNGTKMLDIITTSRGSGQRESALTSASLVGNLMSGSNPSWQTIMKDIYELAKYRSPLPHVNGDEDNPGAL